MERMKQELDTEGFLINPTDWDEQLATRIAEEEGITLTEAHWEVIYLVRNFYNEFDVAPVNRALVNYVRENLGAEKGSSMYLMTLFPGTPAKLAAKISGLPKPANCL